MSTVTVFFENLKNFKLHMYLVLLLSMIPLAFHQSNSFRKQHVNILLMA